MTVRELIKPKKTRRMKQYACLMCGFKKPAKEFPKSLITGRWTREICWDCLESDNDGYVVML